MNNKAMAALCRSYFGTIQVCIMMAIEQLESAIMKTRSPQLGLPVCDIPI